MIDSKNCTGKLLLAVKHVLSFTLVLTFVSCNNIKPPVQESETIDSASVNYENNKKKIDTLNCVSAFTKCDSCLTKDEIIIWELGRGAIQVDIDANANAIALNRAYKDRFGEYISENNLFFFYQDTTSAVKEFSRYALSEYLNQESGKKILYSFSKTTKYYNESKYLDEFLYSNKNIVESRKSVNLIDTAIIENKIKVYPTKHFCLEALVDNALCFAKTTNKTGDYSLTVNRGMQPEWSRLVSYEYNYCGSNFNFLPYITLKSPNLSGPWYDQKYMESSDSSFLECQFVLSHIFEINYSEHTLRLDPDGLTFREQNLALYHYTNTNQHKSSPLMRKLKRLTSD